MHHLAPPPSTGSYKPFGMYGRLVFLLGILWLSASMLLVYHGWNYCRDILKLKELAGSKKQDDAESLLRNWADKKPQEFKDLLQKARHFLDAAKDKWGVGRDPDEALLAVADLQIQYAVHSGEHQFLAEAEKTVQACTTHMERARWQIALGYAAVAQHNKARQLFSQALAKLNEGENARLTDFARQGLADFQVHAAFVSKDVQYFEQALKTVDTAGKDARAYSFMTIAIAQAKFALANGNGDYFANAFQTIEGISAGYPIGLHEVLALQARHALKTKNQELFAETVARVKKIFLRRDQAKAFAAIALTQAEVAVKAEAMQTFRLARGLALQAELWPHTSLTNIVSSLAQAATETGDVAFLSEAISMVPEILDPFSKGIAYYHIAKAQAVRAVKTTDPAFFEQAKETAQKASPTAGYFLSLNEIGMGLAEMAVIKSDATFLDQARQMLEAFRPSDRPGQKAQPVILSATIRLAAHAKDDALLKQGLVMARELNNDRASRTLAMALFEAGLHPVPDDIWPQADAATRFQLYFGLAAGWLRQKGWWGPIAPEQLLTP